MQQTNTPFFFMPPRKKQDKGMLYLGKTLHETLFSLALFMARVPDRNPLDKSPSNNDSAGNGILVTLASGKSNKTPFALPLILPLIAALAICLLISHPAVAQEHATFKVLSIWDDADQSLAEAPLSYADQTAPKGGLLRLTASGTFDSFNPFSSRGVAAGRLPLTYETLAATAEGDDFAMRGLLAEKFIIPADRSWVEVYLRPEAKFSDGTPVTAKDVLYSFTALTTEGSPMYKNYYANVTSVIPTGSHSVKFTFSEAHNRELPLIITQLPVLPSHWWKERDLGQPTTTPMPGSGPYTVVSFKMGSSIILKRNENWWGNELPMHKGRYNFDTIQIDYYRSMPVAREAFLAGEADFYMENTIKDWFSAYDSPDIHSGHIVKAEIPQQTSHGMTGFFFNTRSSKFQNRNVRQAIALLFDFEWTNKRLFHDAYTRCDSFFSGSPLAAGDTLSPAEKDVIRFLNQPIDYDLDAPTPRQSVSDASGNIRDRFSRAMSLLTEAGWNLHDGKMVNAQGEQLRFTLSLVSPNMQRVALPFRRNLERIGIQMDVEVPDQTRYISQVRSFDYDMILSTIRQSDHPGNEQRNFWSSQAARNHGSRNYAGISDPLIDALVERLIESGSKAELVAASHALDWLLLQGTYIIPGWYSKDVRIAWRATTITPPEKHPKTGFDITTWYKAPSDKDKHSAMSGTPAYPGKTANAMDSASSASSSSSACSANSVNSGNFDNSVNSGKPVNSVTSAIYASLNYASCPDIVRYANFPEPSFYFANPENPNALEGSGYSTGSVLSDVDAHKETQ